jgi:hypothetical protein
MLEKVLQNKRVLYRVCPVEALCQWKCFSEYASEMFRLMSVSAHFDGFRCNAVRLLDDYTEDFEASFLKFDFCFF